MSVQFHFRGPARFSLRDLLAGARDLSIAAVCLAAVVGIASTLRVTPPEKIHRAEPTALLARR